MDRTDVLQKLFLPDSPMAVGQSVDEVAYSSAPFDVSPDRSGRVPGFQGRIHSEKSSLLIAKKVLYSECEQDAEV